VHLLAEVGAKCRAVLCERDDAAREGVDVDEVDRGDVLGWEEGGGGRGEAGGELENGGGKVSCEFFPFLCEDFRRNYNSREVEEKLFSLKKAAHLPHRRAGGGEHLLGAARGVLPSAESVGELLLDLGGGGAGRGRLALLLGALVVIVVVF
jgi:hypothetical protein